MSKATATATKKSETSSNGSEKTTQSLSLQVMPFKAMKTEITIVGEEPGLLVSRLVPETLLNPPTKEQLKNPEFIKEMVSKARYLMSDGTDAISATYFPKAIARAAQRFYGFEMATVYGMLRIPCELIPLQIPRSYETHVAVAKNWNARGAAVVTHRPWYREWKSVIPVVFWEDRIKFHEVIDLFRITGSSVGLGAWRIDRSGVFGAFQVPTATAPVVYDRWEKRS